MSIDEKFGSFTLGPGYLLSRVGTAVQAGFKEMLGGWGLRPLHFLILMGLRASGGSSQQALCRDLGIDSGNMVDLVDRLEEAGYAKRTRDPKDRRRYIVTITSKGRSALTQILFAVDDFDRRFLDPLSEDEQRQLAGLLAKLYAVTAESRGEGFVRPRPSVDNSMNAEGRARTQTPRAPRNEHGRRRT